MSFYRMESVSYTYPGQNSLLESLSMDIEVTDRLGIRGPNGSGKTTLIKLLLGILKPHTGSIMLKGKNIKELSLSDIGRTVGVSFQNPDTQLFAPTVFEQVEFGLIHAGLSIKEAQDKVYYWLEYFELVDKAKDLCLTLSRGQKQRVILASAMARGTDFFIMDEPTTGLDILMIDKLQTCLTKLTEQKKGYILISHDKDFLDRNVETSINLYGNGGNV